MLIDGAHNPQGMRALAASLAEEFANQEWVLVMSAMKDKDLVADGPAAARAMFAAPIATETGSSRASPADELAASSAGQYSRCRSKSIPDPDAALARARELAGPKVRSS